MSAPHHRSLFPLSTDRHPFSHQVCAAERKVATPKPVGGSVYRGRVSIEIMECTTVTPDVVEAFARLIPQLSSSNPPPTAEELAEIAASPTTVLLLARDDTTIVGTLTLAVFRIPTGVRAWIEDVVVDQAAHGRGVAEALNRAAIERASHPRSSERRSDLTAVT